MSLFNPYKGLFPYTSKDVNIFFGREKESADLTEMIKNNKVVVFYGESGTGKTSLINAKLFPVLRSQYYFPILIRINFSAITPPLELVRSIIYKELHSWDSEVPEFTSDLTLVKYASRINVFKGLVKPILFFDQFEELFTIAPKYTLTSDIENFIIQLSELAEISPYYKDISDEEYSQNEKYLSSQKENILRFKIVLSLRQDFIAQLDDLRFKMPSIASSRYRLKKFNYVQAYEAIVKPAIEVTKQYPDGDDSKLIIKTDAAFKIIKELGKGRATLTTAEDISLMNYSIVSLDKKMAFVKDEKLENLEFDPTILSLYCFQLFTDAKKANEHFPQITPLQVLASPFEQIIRKYYDLSLAKTKLRTAIENLLITSDGRRVLMPLRDFVSKSKVKESDIKNLSIATAILRIYGDDGFEEVEIAHDQVAKQALVSKKQTEANRISRRTKILSVIALAVIFVSIIITYLYVEKQKKDYTVRDLRKKNETQYVLINNLNDSVNSLFKENSLIEQKYIQEKKYTYSTLNLVKSVREESSKYMEAANEYKLNYLKSVESNKISNMQISTLYERNSKLTENMKALQGENMKAMNDLLGLKSRFDNLQDSLVNNKKQLTLARLEIQKCNQQQQQIQQVQQQQQLDSTKQRKSDKTKN